MNQSLSAPSWTLAQTPRRWQSEALAAWTETLRGIASVVTGAGKTVFAQMCMTHFKTLYPNGRFIIVVPTVALLDQWYISLREDLAVPVESIATYSGEGRPTEAGLVNLMVANTARTHAPKLAGTSETMLIVDECHRTASQANAVALKGSHAATLGISATPERQYDNLFDEVLVPALGPIIYHYGYQDALADGVIVPFNLINVSADMTADEQQQYDAATFDIARTFRRFNDGLASKQTLVRKLQNRARIAATSERRIPVAIRLVEDHRRARVLVFHESIEWADAIHRVLTARGVNATLYHSRLSAELRRDNLRLYRNGVFNVLVTCRALDEGVNVPETSVAIVASSTASIRQRIQRLGRILRPAPDKTQASIYTIYLTTQEQKRLIQEAQDLIGTSSVTWMHSTYGG